MRNTLLVIIIVALPATAAAAEPHGSLKPDRAATSGKMLPIKGAGGSNACAAYGTGFVKIDGTETCAKIGGAVRIDAGTAGGVR